MQEDGEWDEPEAIAPVFVLNPVLGLASGSC